MKVYSGIALVLVSAVVGCSTMHEQPEVAAAAHNDSGSGLAQKGDLDGAIREYRQALSLNPNDAMAHSNLGTALSLKGDVDGAILELRQALRLKPNDSGDHSKLCAALMQKRDFDGALHECLQAIRLNPRNAAAFSNSGYRVCTER
ncbi:MAG: tetratricopeptide repeat protein [Deltaproteobacteria bacterium]|nr:tetratricopeptide repeat protein [Deltaproteobacteria bacterium]